jgi:hypothetical protein
MIHQSICIKTTDNVKQPVKVEQSFILLYNYEVNEEIHHDFPVSTLRLVVKVY